MDCLIWRRSRLLGLHVPDTAACCVIFLSLSYVVHPQPPIPAICYAYAMPEFCSAIFQIDRFIRSRTSTKMRRLVQDFPPRKLDIPETRPWAGKMSMPSLTTNFTLASKSVCPLSPWAMLTVYFLALSSILSARSSRSLTERRISHIISVCPDPIPAELPESGLTHMRISIEDVDYADLLSHLPAACRFIDQAMRDGGTVLVHCVQGLSRSAAVVAAYCKCSGLSRGPQHRS